MSLKKEFASGVFYTAIAKYSGIIVQLFITAVLSRILTPDDFGVVAIATILIQFFNTFSEAGIGPAIIQRKSLLSTEINSIFTFTLLLGLSLSVGFYFCASIIGNYYQNAAIESICKWLSILILFSGADVVTNSLLLKQKKFKTIAIRTLSVQIITGILSIYVAYYGWGMYALVLSAISSKVLIFLINYWCNPLRFAFDFRCLKKIGSYSSYQFGFNIVNYFSRNTDKLIIGKLLGMNLLGFYEKSYRLMMLPLSNITYVFTPVMHPIFSEMQNDKPLMLKRYLHLIMLLGLVSFPVMVFLFFNAKELILIVFGDQWSESILPFQILSLTVALQIIHSSVSGVFQAIDDTKGLFILSFITAIAMIAGFIISGIIFKTIASIAVSFLITCTFGSILTFWVLLHRFNTSFLCFIKTLKLPIILGIIEVCCVGGISLLINNNDLFLSLLIKTSICITVFLFFIHITKIINLRVLISRLKNSSVLANGNT
ncbi:MAG: lipopolysaccharide biosynthesis protein [Paramuribaculum sp.]|nr:lipopolysaccharide biosynthesis protein [Paramuribaculum sp.]